MVKSMVPNTLKALIVLFVASVNVLAASAQEQAEIGIGYLRAYAPQLALSVLDVAPRDEGVAGAEVAIGDNNTTGAFLGQKFSLDVTEVEPDADVVAAFEAMAARGER
ncbi:MAG: branched-chain amino acid ABC transporter substrate-binding protein, partial [Pseudaminobacter sp.]